eukprot:CAMPEP_0119144218 /NCGR_PEP_ID=MMETSP1310-20130426/35544_1 /TAXON_ID=464262 /ORGANISM="Genus nov. species nov., Strain RCC2339" /LENGTH=146 /DNA_ID=CAMNT_0007135937 /DNA_START=49 /DNA_END=486 /DNA_ORIENTATION=+
MSHSQVDVGGGAAEVGVHPLGAAEEKEKLVVQVWYGKEVSDSGAELEDGNQVVQKPAVRVRLDEGVGTVYRQVTPLERHGALEEKHGEALQETAEEAVLRHKHLHQVLEVEQMGADGSHHAVRRLHFVRVQRHGDPFAIRDHVVLG